MDARENTRFEPDYVVAPGETLLEVLEEKGMTQVELARRTGLTAKHVNQIVKGQATITAETATKLERATAVPARVWLGLQATFDEGTSRLNESAQLAAEVGWLTDFPVRELVKRGYLRRCDHAVDQLRELLNFFGVATRQAFSVLWNQQVAFRQSAVFDSDQGSVAAWLRMGELDAAQIECAPYVLAIIERTDAPTAAAAIVDGGFLTVSELDETLAAFFDSAQPPAAAQAPARPTSFVSFRWSPRRVDIRIGRFTCSSSSLVELARRGDL